MSCPEPAITDQSAISASDYVRRIADIESAILSTVAYNDVFGYPPDLEEIHRYLHGMAAGADTVTSAVTAMVDAGALCSDGSAYALPEREKYFSQRAARKVVADDLWHKARQYAAMLASIPTVQMVGVTGSLAVDNTEPGADIDFMLIVDGGTVWRTRAVCKLLQLANHRIGGRLCINYIISERALLVPDQSLYVAHELAQMVPLYGAGTCTAFREANGWVEEYLPNASGCAATVTEIGQPRAMRTIGGPFFRNPLADRIERWESGRKLHRYNETDFLPGSYSRFSEEATGHRMHVRDDIEGQYFSRLTDDDPARPPRVLFGQSYHLYFDPKLWREQKPYPPLGSLYAAAIARDAGFDVRFFDSMLSTNQHEWEMTLDRHRPDVVVLFEDNFNYLTKMCLLRMREAAEEMIAAARTVAARVFVCSSDAADHSDLYLAAGAEAVIRGEGEQVLLQLLQHIRDDNPSSLAQIPGLSYCDDDGVLRENARMPVIRALDKLPEPAWDLVALKKYRGIWLRRHKKFSINLVTTRGCPYHCNWCAKPIWGQRYNSRSPELVVAELATLVRNVGPDHVWFMDDIFGLKRGWVQRFAECLEEANISIKFKCLTRPDLLRRTGEVAALARAGCETVWIGAESGSQKVLDAMEKGTAVEDIETMTAELRDHGIRVGHFVQFGYPGEDWRDIRATLAMLRRSLPDELGVSVSYPLPGTPFFERVQSELGAKQNWEHSDDLAMLFHGPFSSDFYRALHRHVHVDLAWHRTARQLMSGKLFRFAPQRQLGRLGLFAWHSILLPVSWLNVWLRSRRRPDDSIQISADLDRQAAATPSDQGID